MRPHTPLPARFLSGPFTYANARSSGLTNGRLRGNDLARPFRGVRVHAAVDLTLMERCRALALRMPDDAFFSSATAALLLGAPLPYGLERDTGIHVARPAPAEAMTMRGVVGHRVSLMGDDVRVTHGLRISSPARAWCEVAELLAVPDLVAVGDYLIQWRLPIATIAELDDGVKRYRGRRGRAGLRAALPLLDDHAESRQESLFRVFLFERGYTGFVANYPVTAFGRNHRIDIAFPQHKVALEYQGSYHLDPEQRRRDMSRRSRLEAAGWHVLEVNADDLVHPAELDARIRAFLALWR